MNAVVVAALRDLASAMDRLNASHAPRSRVDELQRAGEAAVEELLLLGGDDAARLIIRIQHGTLGPDRIRQEAARIERGNMEAR